MSNQCKTFETKSITKMNKVQSIMFIYHVYISEGEVYACGFCFYLFVLKSGSNL